MHNRRFAIFGGVQLGLAVCLGGLWIWATTWRNAAVEDMADQLVIDGIISQEHAAKLRAQNGSIGAYLQQGWDRRVLIAGGAMVVTSLLGAGGAIVLGGPSVSREEAGRVAKRG